MADLTKMLEEWDGEGTNPNVIINKRITEFVLDDFAEHLTESELIELATNDDSREVLTDRFLDACQWWDAAEIAVQVWRENRYR